MGNYIYNSTHLIDVIAGMTLAPAPAVATVRQRAVRRLPLLWLQYHSREPFRRRLLLLCPYKVTVDYLTDHNLSDEPLETMLAS